MRGREEEGDVMVTLGLQILTSCGCGGTVLLCYQEWSSDFMVFPSMVGFPKTHPKMILFNRNTNGPTVVGETHHFRKPHFMVFRVLPMAFLMFPDKDWAVFPGLLRPFMVYINIPYIGMVYGQNQTSWCGKHPMLCSIFFGVICTLCCHHTIICYHHLEEPLPGQI